MSNANLKVIEAFNKGYKIKKDGSVIGLRGNNISLCLATNGYLSFSVRFSNNKVTRVFLHKLQAYQKYGNLLFEDGIVVRHFDGNKLNNSWDNILIGTQSDNMLDIPQNTRIERAFHATSFVRKYNKTEVRDFYNNCKSYKQTMEKFNISSKGTLHFILNK
jgi:hypothetical protein